MKDFGDFLTVLVIAGMTWVLTAILVAVALPISITESSPGSLPVVIATAVSVALVVLWVKGRSISKGEERRKKASDQASDVDVVLAYGALFDGLDTTRYIYDESILPHPKERILEAALRVRDDPSMDGLIRAGAALAVELSQFQKGVGHEPLATLQAVMFDTTVMTGQQDSIDQHARAIAGYKMSDIELRSDREREKLLALFTEAVR